MWTCPSGFVEAGEQAEEAMRREVLEETRVEVDLEKARSEGSCWTQRAARSAQRERLESAAWRATDPDADATCEMPRRAWTGSARSPGHLAGAAVASSCSAPRWSSIKTPYDIAFLCYQLQGI